MYTLLVFIIFGFLGGFFLKRDSQKEKSKFAKMEKEAELNKVRISTLKERVEILEKENRVLGGSGIGK